MKYQPLFILLLISVNCLAKTPYQPDKVDPLSELWRYAHIGELDGKGIRSIAKDNKGIFWFGVNNGIVSYDGYNLKLFSSKDGLLGRAVDNILVRSNNEILATTSSGLFYLDGSKWKRFFPLKSKYTFTFNSIKELSDGSIACSITEGLLLISKNREVTLFSTLGKAAPFLENFPKVKLVEIPDDAAENGSFLNVSDVLEYEKGLIWMAISFEQYGKILTFNLTDAKDGKIDYYTVYSKKNNVLLGEDQKLLKAKDNSVWIINRSYKIGINRFDGKKWDYFKLSSKFGGDEYKVSISESPNGTIWIGGLGNLYSFAEGNWRKYRAPEFNIPAARIITYPDKDEKLWIVGLHSKVYLVDISQKNWKTYLGLNYQCQDKASAKWFLSTAGKVVLNKNNSWHSYGIEDGLIDAPVRVICSSKGQIWVAGSHQGKAATAYLINDQWVKQIHSTLSWGIDYRAVFESKDGSLWFGGSVDRDPQKGQLGGVLQLKNPLAFNQEWVYHKYRENGLDQSNAYGFGQSADGVIWLGGGKLYYYNGKKWTLSNQELFHTFINIVYNDPKGKLYVGSRYYGIFIYDNKGNWKQYDTKDGLESNTIISFASNKDYIYAATDSDISCFDGKSWTTHVFPVEMNMPNEGGNIYISPDNLIWINKSSREWKRRAFSYTNPQNEAFDGFKSYSYRPDHTPPKTKIVVYSKEVQKSGNTIISWEGFDFFNKTPKNKLQYSYRLNGLEWSPFSSERFHTFIGLDAGNYIFEVKARDLDFNIDPHPVRIQFTVLAPIWKQTWFLALIFCFALIFISLEVRILSKNKKLSALNLSLNNVNKKLKIKNRKIKVQNNKIVKHQEELEESNKLLENQKHEIECQLDVLQEMMHKIEVLSKSKTKFFTNITHEFRTPLTLIKGPIDRLVTEQMTQEESFKLYDIIKRNTYRLQKLINQLLDMRNIESGTLELILRKEDIVHFVLDVKNLFNNLAEQRNIKFSFRSGFDRLEIAFDQDKIEKIIFNLLSNAFKYTPPGGQIQLKLYRQKNSGTNKEYLYIEVVDTGKGIAQEHLEKIFERYYRVSDVSKTKYFESTGIGLSYIKELIEFHNGEINVESTLGVGTCFRVCIPVDLSIEPHALPSAQLSKDNWVEELPNPAPYANSSSKSSENEYSLLIVEDNEDMMSFLHSILKEHFNLIEASNGLEAFEICKSQEVDLILTDIMMPQMDGLEFCHKIKTNFETSHIPLILLTAKNKDEYKIEGYEHGADAYIEKPFNTNLLLVRIKKLLESREQLKTKFSQEFLIKPKEIKVTNEDENFLKKLVNIMEENISESDFDVNKMCEMVNRSHIQFIRKVKQLTGKKPIDLLKSFRLQRAKQLLEQEKLTVSEIAYMVGYDLPNSFSRAFRKEYGISPTEFLEKKV